MRSPALTFALILTLGGAAYAQEKKPPRRTAAKPTPADAQPAGVPAKSASTTAKSSNEEVDQHLQALATSLAAFKSCVDAWDWMNQDLAATTARAAKSSEAAVPVSSSGDNPTSTQMELVLIKKTRLDAQHASCVIRKNALGTLIGVTAADIALVQIQTPNAPGLDARRAKLSALDDDYVAAGAKFGTVVKKMGVVPISGPGTVPKHNGFSHF
jgi:hypothetical protein